MRHLFAGIVVVVVPGIAVADPLPLLGRMDPILVGAFGGGHGHGARAPHGWFLGAETGHAWFVGMQSSAARATSTPSDSGWCFGARVGYQLPSGLAVQTRFSKLGVDAGAGGLDEIAGGVRYSLPIVPMPFAEAEIGATFDEQEVAASAGVGIGMSLLVARHVSFDVAAHDWIVDLGGIHHIPTLTVAITAGFGG